MDPLSMTVSISAVLQLGGTILSYLIDVRDATEDRMKFAMELSALNSLLTVFQNRIQESKSGDPWFTTTRELGVVNGPLDQLKSDLERLASKLEPVKGLRKVERMLTWKFNKTEVVNILNKIERLKTLISFALSNDLFTLSREIKTDVTQMLVRVTEIQANKRDQEHQDIIDWISSLDFNERQNDIIAKRAEGTGRWLLESLPFGDWFAGKSKTLWCPGLPGGGKTILSSTVVDHLRTAFRGDNVAVVCIYCNYKEQSNQTVCELVASLLKQLVQAQPTPSASIKTFYDKYRRNRTIQPKLIDFTKALQSEISVYSKVFVVVDALDECLETNQRELVTELRSLTSTQPVNLMVTSRLLSSIEGQFQGTTRLDICANDDDVRTYVESRILREPRLARHIKSDHSLQDSIVNKIVSNVRGMFLLAKLHMDSLASKSNRRAIRSALESLPSEVNATYDEAMERIKGQTKDDRRLAERVLSWITYAYRPLSISELQHALAVSSEMTDMDFEAIEDEIILISVCAGLVVIDGTGNTIRLVHYTAQQYFDGNRESLFPDAQTDIAATCVVYLSFEAFGRCVNYVSSDWFGENESEEFLLLQKKNPFLEYASLYWGRHAHGQVEGPIQEMVLQLLERKSNIECAIHVLLPRFDFYRGEYRAPHRVSVESSQFSTMHLLSFFGLEKIICCQLETGAEADLKDGLGRSPLSLAAQYGHESVVGLLLARDNIEVNFKDNNRRSPLSWAAVSGHESVIKLLVARADVEVNSKDEKGRSPLSRVAGRGVESIVKLFLARNDIEVNSNDNAGYSPLSYAAQLGHESIVKLLMGEDAIDTDLKGYDGRSPLSLAAQYGHESVVKLLMGRDDVEIDSKDKTGRSPLSFAAANGHESVVRLLMGRNEVEVDSKDKNGHSPLSFAAQYGHEPVVRLFMTRDDIEVNSKDKFGRWPLLLAAGNGHRSVVELLLGWQGVDISSTNNTGRSPLSLAASHGHDSVVRLLVAQDDINVNSKDKDGCSPLSFAAQYGHEPVARLLLVSDDIDVNLQEKDGRSPLSLAAINGHESVARLLMGQIGIEAGLKDKNGRSPLSFAAENGHESIVRLLLVRDDVEVDSKDEFGCSPLSFAAARGAASVVSLLLARDDVNVDLRDNFGRSSLSFAARNGHASVIMLLLARQGVEMDSKNEYGRSPLSFAAANGQESVVRLLLAQNNIEVNLKDNGGHSPLSLAAQYGYELVGKLLLARDDIDVNSKDIQGRTPLSFAAQYGHELVVKILLARDDIDVNSEDETGRSPLSFAAQYGVHEVMGRHNTYFAAVPDSVDDGGYLLPSFGYFNGPDMVAKLFMSRDDIDVNSKDNNGRSPLSFAAQYRHHEMVRLLVARNDIEVNSKDKDGRSPLLFAAQFGHKEVVRLLLGRDDVEVDSEDYFGRSPQWIAEENGHNEVVTLLRAKTPSRFHHELRG